MYINKLVLGNFHSVICLSHNVDVKGSQNINLINYNLETRYMSLAIAKHQIAQWRLMTLKVENNNMCFSVCHTI